VSLDESRQNRGVHATGVDVPSTTGAGFRLTGIWKTFGSLQVLRGVDLEVAPGDLHALVGENGAGKTTLVRILAGLERADQGTIEVGGRRLSEHPTAREARDAGVGLVPQHCEVVPGLTVLENLTLGREPARYGVLRRQEARASAQEVAQRLGFAFDWDAPAESLGLGQRQRLELVRLLWRRSSVLVLDEPTTVLTAAEAEGLYRVLQGLAEEGRTVLFITHKLEEVRRVAENVTVLRGGEVVGHISRAKIDVREVARLMIGDVVTPPTRGAAQTSDVRLRLTDVSTRGGGSGAHPLRDIDLMVRAGEIVGVAGVEGNGQAELCEVVVGLRRPESGTVELEGQPIESDSVARRRGRGLGSIPSDRLHEGVNAEAPLWENLVATAIAGGRGTRLGVVPRRSMRDRARRIIEDVGVRGTLDLPARALSGGNIQRLVVGRELEDDPRVLVAAHPTRGVDVRGIAFIHQRLLGMRDAGCAILAVSADLDELSAIADRVVVMFDGRIVGSYVPGELDAAEIGLLMTGAVVPA
jgi:general nucleoside transport system ATP-binding protein